MIKHLLPGEQHTDATSVDEAEHLAAALDKLMPFLSRRNALPADGDALLGWGQVARSPAERLRDEADFIEAHDAALDDVKLKLGRYLYAKRMERETSSGGL